MSILDEIGGAVVSGGRDVIGFGGEVIHIGEGAIAAATNAIGGAVTELTHMLDLLGDPKTVHEAAKAFESMATSMDQGSRELLGIHEIVASGRFWKGDGANKFDAHVLVLADHMGTAGSALQQVSFDLKAYGDGLDEARQRIQQAIDRLGGFDPVDVVTAPFKIPGIVDDAHAAANKVQRLAEALAPDIQRQAMRAPDVGNVDLHRPSTGDHIMSALHNNWDNFIHNPVGYYRDFKAAELQGLWDGAKGLALSVWSLGKAGFEEQWGTILGIQSWKDDANKTFLGMANGL